MSVIDDKKHLASSCRYCTLHRNASYVKSFSGPRGSSSFRVATQPLEGERGGESAPSAQRKKVVSDAG